MMDGELQMMESFDSNSLSRETFQQLQQHGHPSPPQQASSLDTLSGKSRAEEDTIDNIHTEDGSVLAWFSRQRKERAKKRQDEDGTLESEPALLDARSMDPLTNVQKHRQQQQQNNQISPQQVQSQSQRRFFSPVRKPAPDKPQYAHEDNIELDASVENPSNTCIPGFIFVTSGQSSSVQTRESNSQPTKFKTVSDEIVDDDDRAKRCLSNKVIVLCLVLAIVISGIMLTVVFTNNRTESGSSASAQSSGTTPAIPTFAPASPNSPTIVDENQSSPPQVEVPAATESLIPTSPTTTVPSSFVVGSTVPTISPSPESQTLIPSFDPTESLTPTIIQSSPTATAPSSTVFGTLAPTISHSPENQPMIPSLAPTSNVAARIEGLSPMSSEAWLNPDSPQSLAVAWLIDDSEAGTFSNAQLLQRYVLATLYYSTSGESWSENSISWIVDWTDECTWWGVECNTAGGVQILQLANGNLSGSLPPELELLSNSLEEVYMNGNKISGTIPSSIGLLSKLSKFGR
jgi:hypothetical protein